MNTSGVFWGRSKGARKKLERGWTKKQLGPGKAFMNETRRNWEETGKEIVSELRMKL